MTLTSRGLASAGRGRAFLAVSTEWKAAYDAGIFTEFMEQRAPGHTVLGDVIYRKGFLDLIADVEQALATLDDNAGGARYNTTYMMPVGIGTVNDTADQPTMWRWSIQLSTCG
jgi:hypothetical protein